jgi:hypothetical protein
MGNSSPNSFATGGNPSQTSSPQHHSFGDVLGSYLMNSFPLMGHIGQAIFNPNHPQAGQAQAGATQPGSSDAYAPPPVAPIALPAMTAPDMSMSGGQDSGLMQAGMKAGTSSGIIKKLIAAAI